MLLGLWKFLKSNSSEDGKWIDFLSHSLKPPPPTRPALPTPSPHPVPHPPTPSPTQKLFRRVWNLKWWWFWNMISGCVQPQRRWGWRGGGFFFLFPSSWANLKCKKALLLFRFSSLLSTARKPSNVLLIQQTGTATTIGTARSVWARRS